jgi:hypothetical protein
MVDLPRFSRQVISRLGAVICLYDSCSDAARASSGSIGTLKIKEAEARLKGLEQENQQLKSAT